MTTIKNAVNLLQSFSDWSKSGGEQRAGLPSGSSTKIDETDAQMIYRSSSLQNQIQQIKSTWAQLTSGSETPEVLNRTLTKKLLLQLDDSIHTSNTLMEQAVILKADLQPFQTIAKNQIKEVKKQILNSNSQKQSAEMALALARTQYNQARSELEGGKGFGNGFLTGLTLGIYNPVKKNLDKAKNAVATRNNQIAIINRQIQLYQTADSELNQCQNLLSKMFQLDIVITGFENLLNKIGTNFQAAFDHEEKAITTSNEKVAAYYQRLVGKDMTGLFALNP
ncbi:hypothetical protein AAGF08_20125 [Algoriphagus sp. SE2]|uniref:hypothetical protein n=1 Tax=Algoriphagus sp. SE2 TaxID=3141536 RepID=UPI0031CCE68E